MKHLCYKPSSICLQMILPRPSWSGFMSKVHRRTSVYSTSAVLPLPFVNMDPTKLSTMYTCILLATEQRKKCGWHCITITFDLPLAKTREMVLVEGQLPGVSIRLGGFHYWLLSRVRSVTGNGTDASSIYARRFII